MVHMRIRTVCVRRVMPVAPRAVAARVPAVTRVPWVGRCTCLPATVWSHALMVHTRAVSTWCAKRVTRRVSRAPRLALTAASRAQPQASCSSTAPRVCRAAQTHPMPMERRALPVTRRVVPALAHPLLNVCPVVTSVPTCMRLRVGWSVPQPRSLMRRHQAV